MLVNVVHESRAEHRRLLLFGLVFAVVVALLIGLSIAIYEKVFTPTTFVTVKAHRAGLQLAKYGDVRVHGVLVGQVREITQDGRHASITLGLEPAAAQNIPRNVSVEILPTTLFGQKYISFLDPARPSREPLQDGQVIPARRVSTNVELSKILADLFGLLRSVRPADLSRTLYAISHALSGNGERIGRTMVDLDAYLTEINVHLPTLRRDLVLLAKVSRAYDLAAPDLVRILRNATVTSRTITAKRDTLPVFISSVTSLAKTSTRVLQRNDRGIVAETRLSAPMMRLLDTYAPEYPCLIKGTARYTKNLAEIFQGGRVRQSMRFDAKQRRSYDRRDLPVYGGTGHGPWCLGLPHPKVPAGYHPLADGSDLDNPGGG